MQAYLDNSATTRCSERAGDLMVRLLKEDYGNPSSLHGMGKAAEDYVREARRKIAKTLKAEDKEIIFTSGGTESNNMALIGAARANCRAGKHIVTTRIEHASVMAPLAYLEEEGFEITYLGVDAFGVISLDELAAAVRDDTILVSIMMINNEIGAVEPIEAAAKIIKAQNANTLFHVDAIQAYGKLRVYPKRMGIDLLSVSGHKIHAPKGTGFLYVRDKVKVKPILFGGGQQKGMRSGTENVPGIAALGEAAEEMHENLEERVQHLYCLKQRFARGVAAIGGVTINGTDVTLAAPHIVSVSIDGVRSEVMLHALEERQIYVSAGSACSSNKPSVSRTLKSIGLKQNLLDSTIRFSFCGDTTEEEIDYAVEAMKEIVPKLQKYTKK